MNYLARFLLAYDAPSRRLWRARAADIPLTWGERQVAARRGDHLAEFVGSVEQSLCEFTPESGRWAEPPTPRDAARVRQLLTLLRSVAPDAPPLRGVVAGAARPAVGRPPLVSYQTWRVWTQF